MGTSEAAVSRMKDQVTIPELPSSIADNVALDLNKRIIYVTHDIAVDSHLLSWLARCKSQANVAFTIVKKDYETIEQLREDGLQQAIKVDDDLRIRNAAIEMISKAAKYRASDIHIMMRGKFADVQIVVKGGLRVLRQMQQEECEALERAIYQGIADVKDSSYNPLEFQNGQISGATFDSALKISSVRIVRGPCYPQSKGGKFMTLRLQYLAGPARNDWRLHPLDLPKKPAGEFNIAKMGYSITQVEKLRAMMDSPSGVVIFTGPTGSGKTTTMFEALKEIARHKPYKRHVTIEDPVEYPMSWAVQMAVTGASNDKETGAAFSERMRVALRMAPNIILVGELRGPEVAIAALEASVTGHQVWTTIHAVDPFLVIERIELMDQQRLHRKVFCDPKIIRGVVAQRLLPMLCQDCCIPLDNAAPGEIPNRIISALKTYGDINKVRIKGKGCERCGHEGSAGRFAIAEIIQSTTKLMDDFINHGTSVARRNYRKETPNADKSMLETAIHHVMNGKVDPRAVEDNVDVILDKGLVE